MPEPMELNQSSQEPETTKSTSDVTSEDARAAEPQLVDENKSVGTVDNSVKENTPMETGVSETGENGSSATIKVEKIATEENKTTATDNGNDIVDSVKEEDVPQPADTGNNNGVLSGNEEAVEMKEETEKSVEQILEESQASIDKILEKPDAVADQTAVADETAVADQTAVVDQTALVADQTAVVDQTALVADQTLKTPEESIEHDIAESSEAQEDNTEQEAAEAAEKDEKPIPGVVRLFVGNLNDKTKSEDLRPLFEKYGPIAQCDVRKSYGFVHMKVDEATGDKIVKELTGQVVQGNPIQVKHSISKGPAKSSVKIFVGNLSEKVMPDDLKGLFSKFGTVYECDIIRNYAFVHMEKGDHVDKAVAELAGHSLHGNAINVQLSTSRVRNKPGMGDTEACYRCGKPGHWSKECPRGNQRTARGKPPKGSKNSPKERPPRGRGRGGMGSGRPPYPPPHPHDRFPEREYDNYGGDFDYGYAPRPRGFPEDRRGYGMGGRGFPSARPPFMGPGPMRGNPYYDGPEGPMDYGYKRPPPQGGRGYRSFEEYPPRFDRRPSAARGRYMPY